MTKMLHLFKKQYQTGMGIYIILHTILPESHQMVTVQMLKMRHVEIGLLPGPATYKQGLYHCITSCVSNLTQKISSVSLTTSHMMFKGFTELECKEIFS